MNRTVMAALVAVALAAPAFTPAARADVSVTFNPGVVAYGYQDGYWDRDHAWHTWSNDRDRDDWRGKYAEHYYDRAHTAAPDNGWRRDSWWGDKH